MQEKVSRRNFLIKSSMGVGIAGVGGIKPLTISAREDDPATIPKRKVENMMM